MSVPVVIPLLNPNEADTLIAAIHVEEGQKVSVGDLLCSVETTKSTAELRAEKEGFVARIRFQPGQNAQAGETLCYITSSLDEEIPDLGLISTEESQTGKPTLPGGLKITQPALKLAGELKLNLDELPENVLITESWIQEHKADHASEKASFLPPSAFFDPTGIIVYGGGGHGKMVIDLIRARGGYLIAGILDDGRQEGDHILGVPILGGEKMLPELTAKGVRLAANGVGGIGNIAVRINIFNKLTEAGLVCPAIVHPAAYLDPSALLSAGVQVFAQAYVGGEVRIGYGCIINTGAIISHDCHLGAYVNVSPGAILAGEVEVEGGALIGMGATLNLGVKVGEGARIGNGATVKSDVPAGGVVRAGSVWPS
jgi:acetyltransferase EpsM